MYEKTYTVYVAFDGEEFDFEDDCLNYERSFWGKNVEGQIFFYNRDFSKLPLTEVEEVIYVHILTEEASKWFKKQSDYVGAQHPWESNPSFPLTGIFYYDVNINDWRELESEYKELKNALEKIKEVR